MKNKLIYLIVVIIIFIFCSCRKENINVNASIESDTEQTGAISAIEDDSAQSHPSSKDMTNDSDIESGNNLGVYSWNYKHQERPQIIGENLYFPEYKNPTKIIKYNISNKTRTELSEDDTVFLSLNNYNNSIYALTVSLDNSSNTDLVKLNQNDSLKTVYSGLEKVYNYVIINGYAIFLEDSGLSRIELGSGTYSSLYSSQDILDFTYDENYIYFQEKEFDTIKRISLNDTSVIEEKKLAASYTLMFGDDQTIYLSKGSSYEGFTSEYFKLAWQSEPIEILQSINDEIIDFQPYKDGFVATTMDSVFYCKEDGAKIDTISNRGDLAMSFIDTVFLVNTVSELTSENSDMQVEYYFYDSVTNKI